MARFQFVRHLHRTAPLSKTWTEFYLRQSRSILKGIAIFYAGAAACGTVGYFGGKWYVDQWQPMCSSWSLYSKCLGRLGVYLQETGDDANAEMSIIYCLKAIGQDEGIEQPEDESNPRLFKLLTADQLNDHKSDEFKSRYLDLVMRLALIKGENGDFENSWKLCQYSINLPMDKGSRHLKSQMLRLASKLDLQKGEVQPAEFYLLDAVRFNEYYEDGVRFVQHGSLTLSKDSNVPNELFHSLLDLGVVYTKEKQYTKALEIFLNLLQVTEHDKPEGFVEANRSLLKNYVGEILYSQGLTNQAIEWCRDSFKEARINSKFDPFSATITKQSLQNLVKLYEKIGDDDLKNQAQQELDKCVIPVKVNRDWALLEKMLS